MAGGSALKMRTVWVRIPLSVLGRRRRLVPPAAFEAVAGAVRFRFPLPSLRVVW